MAATVFYEEQSVLKFLCNVLKVHDHDQPPRSLKDSERKLFAEEIKGIVHVYVCVCESECVCVCVPKLK